MSNNPSRPGLKASLKRTWGLGLLATDMMRTRFQRSEKHIDRARNHLIERMGSLHGLPQKIGQILSLNELRDGGVGEGMFTRLTENRQSLPSIEAFAEIENQLNRPLSECFRLIEGSGISASLSQVHPAVLHDGRKVAVKVQYPGIEEALWTDLRALGWLTSPVGGLNRGFDLKAYREEVGRMIRDELDYEKEARVIRTFGAFATGLDGVRIPEVIGKFSSGRIITMTWIGGEPFGRVLSWPVEDRIALGENILRFFLMSCFNWKLLHADPHPGNYRFSRENGQIRIGLLDFGCVKNLDSKTISALKGLILDLLGDGKKNLRKKVLGRFLDMGFREDLIIPMADRLIPLSRVLFEPFLANEPYSLKRWKLGDRVGEVLGPLRWNFRFAGPAQLMLFVRAYQGLVQYLSALDVPVYWRGVLNDVLEGVEMEKGFEEGKAPEIPVQGRERNLRVRVTEWNEPKVDLTFRARAAGSLPDLIPEDLRPKLEHRSIDLEKIARRAVETGFSPGELFRLEEGPKMIRVWLE